MVLNDQITNLQGYIDQIRGVSYKKENVSDVPKEGFIPLLKANNIQNGELNYSDLIYVDKSIIQHKQLLIEGDILIAASSGSKSIVGKSAQIKSDIGEITFGAFCKVVRPKERINPYYLGYYFLSPRYRHSIENVINGANINNLKNEHIDQLNILIPESTKQEEIVEVLNKITYVLKVRQQQITALSNLEESIFHYYFIGSNNNDEKVKLKELCEINPKKSEVKELKDDLRVSFIPMDAVSETGEIEYQKSEQLSHLYNRYTYFKENDVLFAKITPCMENGKGAIARGLTNEIGFGSTEFHILRPKSMVNSEWVFYLTKSRKFRKEAEDNMTGSAGQKRVPKKFLENYLVTIPNFNKLQAFQHKVANTTKLKQQLQESLKHYENLYNSLMQKAFKGELFRD